MRQTETCDRDEGARCLFGGDGPVRVSDIVGAGYAPGSRPAVIPARRATYRRAITGWYDLSMIVLFIASAVAVLACLLHG